MVQVLRLAVAAVATLQLAEAVKVPKTKFGLLYSLQSSDFQPEAQTASGAAKQLSVVEAQKGYVMSEAPNRQDEAQTNAMAPIEHVGAHMGEISSNYTDCYHGYCAHIEGHYDSGLQWSLWQTLLLTFVNVAEYPVVGEDCHCHINKDESITCQTCYIKNQKLPKKMEVRIQGPEHQGSWMSIELTNSRDENICKSMVGIAEGIAGYLPFVNAITGQLQGLCGS